MAAVVSKRDWIGAVHVMPGRAMAYFWGSKTMALRGRALATKGIRCSGIWLNSIVTCTGIRGLEQTQRE